jgi:hypothetical protein
MPNKRTDPDKFLREVADDLGQPALVRDAQFQEYCGNAFGLLNVDQAAESWKRDFDQTPRP